MKQITNEEFTHMVECLIVLSDDAEMLKEGHDPVEISKWMDEANHILFTIIKKISERPEVGEDMNGLWVH